jgi:hypothetical protein
MSFVPISSTILLATGYTFCSNFSNKSAIFWPLAHKPMQRTPSTEKNIAQRHKNCYDPQICLTFKNLASYIQDGHTATLQMLHFIYIF